MITPASTTDFTMHSASDGTGTNLTDKFAVAASYGGNSVRYQVNNNGAQTGYITLLQARGRVVAIKEPVIAEKLDQTSIDSFGEAVLPVGMPYQEDPLVAEDAANALLTNWKDPVSLVRAIELQANQSDALMVQALQREPGDRITLIETVTGINRDFFINGVEFQISAPDILNVIWIVVAAESQLFWIVGVTGFSEVGQTTFFGY
jgi:hypothetical protein